MRVHLLSITKQLENYEQQVECSKELTCPGFGGNQPFRGIHTPTQEQIWLLKIHTSESAPEPN